MVFWELINFGRISGYCTQKYWNKNENLPTCLNLASITHQMTFSLFTLITYGKIHTCSLAGRNPKPISNRVVKLHLLTTQFKLLTNFIKTEIKICGLLLLTSQNSNVRNSKRIVAYKITWKITNCAPCYIVPVSNQQIHDATKLTYCPFPAN